MSIRLVAHKDIDMAKWDEGISRCFNGCIYAYSWFLDRVCDDWVALVEGDYESIMPLPLAVWKRKKIIDQPYFAKYLGVFTNKLLTAGLIGEFIKAIPSEYEFVCMNLNKFNIPEQLESYAITKKEMFELDLMASYSKLSSGYSIKALTGIESAHNQKMVVVSGLQPKEFIAFHVHNQSMVSDKISDKDSRRLKSLLSHGLFHNFGEIIGAYDAANKLCASAFFMGSHQRMFIPFFIQSKESPTNSLYLMFDHFIKKHSEKNIVLNIDGCCHKSMNGICIDIGAKPYQYYSIRKNKLSLLYRWMK